LVGPSGPIGQPSRHTVAKKAMEAILGHELVGEAEAAGVISSTWPTAPAATVARLAGDGWGRRAARRGQAGQRSGTAASARRRGYGGVIRPGRALIDVWNPQAAPWPSGDVWRNVEAEAGSLVAGTPKVHPAKTAARAGAGAVARSARGQSPRWACCRGEATHETVVHRAGANVESHEGAPRWRWAIPSGLPLASDHVAGPSDGYASLRFLECAPAGVT